MIFNCQVLISKKNHRFFLSSLQIANMPFSKGVTIGTFKRLIAHLFCFRCFLKNLCWFLAFTKGRKSASPEAILAGFLFFCSKFYLLSSIWIYKLWASRIPCILRKKLYHFKNVKDYGFAKKLKMFFKRWSFFLMRTGLL